MKKPESYTEYLALSNKEKEQLIVLAKRNIENTKSCLAPHPWIACKDRLPKEGEKVNKNS